jgi:hypothetical protein
MSSHCESPQSFRWLVSFLLPCSEGGAFKDVGAAEFEYFYSAELF